MRLFNPEVRIENTNLCNAHCVYCPREKMTRPKVTMPNEHFYSLVIQAQDLGADTISIFGYGEPLIDPDIVSKIQFCTDLGLETFITTNASLLDVDVAHALIKAELTHIRFSFTQLVRYANVHKGLNGVEVLRNIENFLQINKRKGWCKTSMSFTLVTDNDADIDNIIETWVKRVDWLEIWHPHNWTDGRQFRPLTKKRKLRCPRPYNGPLQINADGKVMVCCFDYDAKLTVGDTYKNTIEEILKGEEFQRIRLKHNYADISDLICSQCDQLNIGDENPLLYSSRDPLRHINTTSGIKFNLEE